MAHPTKATDHAGSSNRRRNIRGLTTLEWLLIVAAVAGLAALAVVLVQNVVDETAEQISGSSARLTAALVAAQEITDSCETAGGTNIACTDGTADSASQSDAKAKCERLQITYGDAFSDSAPKKKAIWAVAGSLMQKIDTAAVTLTANTCRIVDA